MEKTSILHGRKYLHFSCRVKCMKLSGLRVRDGHKTSPDVYQSCAIFEDDWKLCTKSDDICVQNVIACCSSNKKIFRAKRQKGANCMLKIMNYLWIARSELPFNAGKSVLKDFFYLQLQLWNLIMKSQIARHQQKLPSNTKLPRKALPIR